VSLVLLCGTGRNGEGDEGLRPSCPYFEIKETALRYVGKLGMILSTALIVAISSLAAPAPADAALSYNLYSPLKKNYCEGDTDGDCLDNVEENNLAVTAGPWYFYDEDDGCNEWENDYGLSSTHFARRDFVQVRPIQKGVRNWSSIDGQAKWISVTYFFLYPHDCASIFFGAAGHQGDSEHIRFYLYSYDLRTWYLDGATYWHHNESHYISGQYMEDRARALNTAYAAVAADEDSHGSWPGHVVDSSDCAGEMDDGDFGVHDCFDGSWREHFNGRAPFDYPAPVINVGGPFPESWLPGGVTVGGDGSAWTDLDVGHGVNREYWTSKSGGFSRFCGWECPSYYRLSDGNCLYSRHDETECANGPLYTKLDYFDFRDSGPSPSLTAASQSLEAEGDTASAAVGPVEIDPVRVERGRRLAAEASARLREAAGSDPAKRDTIQRWLARRAADPVAALVPHLLDAAPERQLATLKWLLTTPEPRRLAALFEDLGEDGQRGFLNRDVEARERLLDLIALLESKGVRAAAPADGFVNAEVAPFAPAPNTPRPAAR
jgi:hypothetical protein